MAELTVEERIAAAQKRREEIKEAEGKLKLEQLAVDLEAIAELEAEHGHERVIRIELGGWKPGLGAPTCIGVLVPTGATHLIKRFTDQVHRTKEHSPERIRAQEQLAAECWVYPEKGSDAQKAVLELCAGIANNIALQVVQAAQGVAEEQGKG